MGYLPLWRECGTSLHDTIKPELCSNGRNPHQIIHRSTWVDPPHPALDPGKDIATVEM